MRSIIVVCLQVSLCVLLCEAFATEYSPAAGGLPGLAGCRFGAVMEQSEWSDSYATFTPSSNFAGWYGGAHLNSDRRAYSIHVKSKRFTSKAKALKLFDRLFKYFRGKCKSWDVQHSSFPGSVANANFRICNREDGPARLDQYLSVSCLSVAIDEDNPDFEIEVSCVDKNVECGDWLRPRVKPKQNPPTVVRPITGEVPEGQVRNSKSENGASSLICTGTGWFVQSNIIVTCAHVVEGAKQIEFDDSDRIPHRAMILALSKIHDLAVLSVNSYVSSEILPLKTKPEKMATHVFTIGYPISDLLGANQKYTDGVISATAGLVGDNTCYQISVPIQPGNSGGALVNDFGEVVGVTSSALNALIAARITGTIPQNVNYAIKARYIAELLEDSGIVYKTHGNGKLDVEKIGKSTVLLKVIQ